MKKLLIILAIPLLSIACGKGRSGDTLTKATPIKRAENQNKNEAATETKESTTQIYKYTPDPSLYEKFVTKLLSIPRDVETYIVVSDNNVTSFVFSDETKSFTSSNTNLSLRKRSYLSCDQAKKVYRDAIYVDTRKSENEFYIGPDLSSDARTNVYNLVSNSEANQIREKIKNYRRACEYDSVKEDEPEHWL
jgi:hypothetical protein